MAALMRGFAWPNRFTHQELMRIQVAVAVEVVEPDALAARIGISGSRSWSFICVQGCQTTSRSRAAIAALADGDCEFT